jgi:hypothetical protein
MSRMMQLTVQVMRENVRESPLLMEIGSHFTVEQLMDAVQRKVRTWSLCQVTTLMPNAAAFRDCLQKNRLPLLFFT